MTAGHLDPDVCYLAWQAAVHRQDRLHARAYAYDLFYWLSQDGQHPHWPSQEAQVQFYQWCTVEKPWLPPYLGPAWAAIEGQQ
jgi:hypothetical protein